MRRYTVPYILDFILRGLEEARHFLDRIDVECELRDLISNDNKKITERKRNETKLFTRPPNRRFIHRNVVTGISSPVPERHADMQRYNNLRTVKILIPPR